MLSGIFDILKSIGEFIVLAFDFVITFLGDTVQMILGLQSAISALPSYFLWLPPAFVSLLAMFFVMVVLLRVLGRD